MEPRKDTVGCSEPESRKFTRSWALSVGAGTNSSALLQRRYLSEINMHLLWRPLGDALAQGRIMDSSHWRQFSDASPPLHQAGNSPCPGQVEVHVVFYLLPQEYGLREPKSVLLSTTPQLGERKNQKGGLGSAKRGSNSGKEREKEENRVFRRAGECETASRWPGRELSPSGSSPRSRRGSGCSPGDVYIAHGQGTGFGCPLLPNACSGDGSCEVSSP